MKTLLFVLFCCALAPAGTGRGDFAGYRCDNECPLAQQANAHRADGTEALAASKALRADSAAALNRSLARI